MGEAAPFGRAGQYVLPRPWSACSASYSRAIIRAVLRKAGCSVMFFDPLAVDPDLAPIVEAVEELLAGVRERDLSACGLRLRFGRHREPSSAGTRRGLARVVCGDSTSNPRFVPSAETGQLARGAGAAIRESQPPPARCSNQHEGPPFRHRRRQAAAAPGRDARRSAPRRSPTARAGTVPSPPPRRARARSDTTFRSRRASPGARRRARCR